MSLLLKSYKKIIDDALLQQFQHESRLQQAMRYALLTSGKRVRPILTLVVADALGNGLPVLESALAVEFSHTASLIADDLPSMDDEKERRGESCLHVKFGEATAILASYGLITEAFGRLEANGREMKEGKAPFCDRAFEASSHAIALASRASGCLGATLGQQLDLFERPDNLEALEKLIYLKTVTLFEIAMAFGWIFGGGDLSRIDEVKKSAYHLGMAFQVRDDLLDFHEDSERECTSNFAVIAGKNRASERFHSEVTDFREKLSDLNLTCAPFQALLEILEKGVIRH